MHICTGYTVAPGVHRITKRVLINASFLGVDPNCHDSHCYRCHLDSSSRGVGKPPAPSPFGPQGLFGWTMTIEDIRDARTTTSLEDEQMPDTTGWGSWDTQAEGFGIQQQQGHGAYDPTPPTSLARSSHSWWSAWVPLSRCSST